MRQYITGLGMRRYGHLPKKLNKWGRGIVGEKSPRVVDRLRCRFETPTQMNQKLISHQFSFSQSILFISASFKHKLCWKYRDNEGNREKCKKTKRNTKARLIVFVFIEDLTPYSNQTTATLVLFLNNLELQ